MNIDISCPAFSRYNGNVPATSARPPVFAYGIISGDTSAIFIFSLKAKLLMHHAFPSWSLGTRGSYSHRRIWGEYKLLSYICFRNIPAHHPVSVKVVGVFTDCVLHHANP